MDDEQWKHYLALRREGKKIFNSSERRIRLHRLTVWWDGIIASSKALAHDIRETKILVLTGEVSDNEDLTSVPDSGSSVRFNLFIDLRSKKESGT